MTGCSTQGALPFSALQWRQLDFECISFILEVYLTTLFSDIFCFGEFFCDRTGRDSQTDGRGVGTCVRVGGQDQKWGGKRHEF